MAKSPPNKSNLVGQRFGNLVVIKELPKRTSKGLVIYQCKCDCGNITEVDSNHLLTGHTQSCGCGKHRINDLTGKQFGRLTVIEYVGRRNGNSMWKCKCSCGNYIETSSSSLHSGATKSCGCLNTEVRSKTAKERFGFVDGTSLVNVSANRAINKNNSSGHRGVHFDKDRKKWVAQITFQRKNHLLGRIDTLEEALEARKQGEKNTLHHIEINSIYAGTNSVPVFLCLLGKKGRQYERLYHKYNYLKKWGSGRNCGACFITIKSKIDVPN